MKIETIIFPYLFLLLKFSTVENLRIKKTSFHWKSSKKFSIWERINFFLQTHLID